MEFNPKTPEALLQSIEQFDSVHYASTRNYVDGGVSRLSPYISRGIISTKEISAHLFNHGRSKAELQKFIQELAWRDYFQLVFAYKSSYQKKTDVEAYSVPQVFLEARTGIEGIDQGLRELTETGYVHNHQRMYIAMLAANIFKQDILGSSRWMYYNLLDADEASNSLSWQWVSGKLTGKRYVANQENINTYCRTQQRGTFLEVTYEKLESLELANELTDCIDIALESRLPDPAKQFIDPADSFFLYNAYHLDPRSAQDLDAQPVLLLEPSHFKRYPMCERSLRFILGQAALIPGIHVFTGEFDALKKLYPQARFHFVKHPLFAHYEGHGLERSRIFEQVNDYYPSFSAYWKRCERFF
jgi:deoxyribodipyrimidine photo-lyase